MLLKTTPRQPDAFLSLFAREGTHSGLHHPYLDALPGYDKWTEWNTAYFYLYERN